MSVELTVLVLAATTTHSNPGSSRFALDRQNPSIPLWACSLSMEERRTSDARTSNCYCHGSCNCTQETARTGRNYGSHRRRPGSGSGMSFSSLLTKPDDAENIQPAAKPPAKKGRKPSQPKKAVHHDEAQDVPAADQQKAKRAGQEDVANPVGFHFLSASLTRLRALMLSSNRFIKANHSLHPLIRQRYVDALDSCSLSHFCTLLNAFRTNGIFFRPF